MLRKNCTTSRNPSINTSARLSNWAASPRRPTWAAATAATAVVVTTELREKLAPAPNLEPAGFRIQLHENEFFGGLAPAQIRLAPVVPVFELNGFCFRRS